MRLMSFIALAGVGVSVATGCTPPDPAPEPETVTESEPPPEASAASVSPDAELAEIRTRLDAVKAELFDDGEYNCCVEPSCNWCALHEGACDCFTNLQAGEEVCPGCGLGWHNGQGIVDGVDADAVEWNITHEHPGGGHTH